MACQLREALQCVRETRDRFKRIAELVQFSTANIFMWLFGKGESYDLVHKTHVFVVFSAIFSSSTFMCLLTIDQICNEYKSCKFSFG